MKTSFGAMTGRERLCFVLKYLFMALCVVVALFPIIWVILSSFKTNAEILSNGISLPTHFGFDGYQSALDMAPIFKFFGNSVIVTCCATVLNVLVFAMAGYAFARFRFPCDKLLYMLLSLSLVIPMTALLQPVYSVVNNLGLYDTKAGLILVNTALNMPMSLLILRGAFQSIPKAIEEAAYIDGANELQILWKVIVPLCKPALATFTLFHAVGHWNGYFNATMYINSRDKWPLMLIVREMVAESGTNMVHQSATAIEDLAQPFTLQMAIIIFTIIPILCVYPFVQKYFMKGMLMGSVKG